MYFPLLLPNQAVIQGDIPSENISWKEVAIQLKNYRHPDDYCRRWPIILTKLKKKTATQNSSSSSSQLRITAKDVRSNLVCDHSSNTTIAPIYTCRSLVSKRR